MTIKIALHKNSKRKDRMIFKNILGKLFKAAKITSGRSEKYANSQVVKKASDNHVAEDMREKEKYVYGEDRIAKQKLYEKWAVKESWHLISQAIPLLLSLDPEDYSDSDIDKKSQDLWVHAQHCVEQGLLIVINKESPADKWEAKPLDVYKWAVISRVELPEQLNTLMSFVMMSIDPSMKVSADTQDGNDQGYTSYNSDKEHMLGAALAMVATYPGQCMNKKGKVSAENIMSLINKNENELFGDNIPNLSSTTVIDLINKWIKICA